MYFVSWERIQRRCGPRGVRHRVDFQYQVVHGVGHRILALEVTIRQHTSAYVSIRQQRWCTVSGILAVEVSVLSVSICTSVLVVKQVNLVP